MLVWIHFNCNFLQLALSAKRTDGVMDGGSGSPEKKTMKLEPPAGEGCHRVQTQMNNGYWQVALPTLRTEVETSMMSAAQYTQQVKAAIELRPK